MLEHKVTSVIILPLQLVTDFGPELPIPDKLHLPLIDEFPLDHDVHVVGGVALFQEDVARAQDGDCGHFAAPVELVEGEAGEEGVCQEFLLYEVLLMGFVSFLGHVNPHIMYLQIAGIGQRPQHNALIAQPEHNLFLAIPIEHLILDKLVLSFTHGKPSRDNNIRVIFKFGGKFVGDQGELVGLVELERWGAGQGVRGEGGDFVEGLQQLVLVGGGGCLDQVFQLQGFFLVLQAHVHCSHFLEE